MLTTLVDQVSKLLGSAYLVSALTPWLIFWLANAATLVLAIGPIASLRQWERVSTSTAAVAAVTFISVVFLILGALLVVSLTTVFKAVLQGRYLGPPLGLFLRRRVWRLQQRVADYERESARFFHEWMARKKTLEGLSELAKAYAESERARRREPGPDEIKLIVNKFEDAFGDGSSPESVTAAATTLKVAYQQFAPSPFEKQHEELVGKARDHETAAREAYAAHERDRVESFADVRQVAPTDYGNAIAASEAYVWRVYGIESGVLWTRLQKVVSKEYLDVVHDAKVRLDFFTAMTLFAGAYGIIWFFLLPYLVPSPGLLAVLVGGVVAATWVFYRAAVEAAAGFSEVFRAAFDLFRRALLEALSIEPPTTLSKERELWERLGSVMVFHRAPSLADDISLGDAAPVETNPKARFE